MKNLIKTTILLFLSVTLFNCNKDDDSNSVQNQLLGKWEVTSGSIIESQPKYLIFNSNNTISFLFEHDLGFKNYENLEYTVSESLIEINFQGFFEFQYTLNQNSLSITDGFITLELTKINNGPSTGDWIQGLSVIREGNAPWNGEVDFAFTYDKTKIVYGMNSTASYIPLIDPLNFNEVGQVATTNQARVVEVEKFEQPNRYLFQSNSNSNLISAYSMNNNFFQFNLDLDNGITGMGSVNSNYLWVASNNNEGSINLVNVADNIIEQSILLNFYNIKGMDFQNNYLYVTDGKYLHKCQTSPSFKSIKSYEISGFYIYGVAFDGTNFWVNGYNSPEGNYKLIKTNLN